MLHLKSLTFKSEKYPDKTVYPFNLDVFSKTNSIPFRTPVTFFIGENGTGKSTLLKAIAKKCNIHIWKPLDRPRVHNNRYAETLNEYIEIEWTEDEVPGAFFSSEIFYYFAEALDEWARVDPGMLKYFGGESLITKSHGQSHMAFFKSRYKIKGLYLIDEPENALSPGRLLELLELLSEMTALGHAQFIIATHSPILLSLPDSDIYSLDYISLKKMSYKETDYYKIYKKFFENR